MVDARHKFLAVLLVVVLLWNFFLVYRCTQYHDMEQTDRPKFLNLAIPSDNKKYFLITMLSMCSKEERNNMRQLQREWFKRYNFIDIVFILDKQEGDINCEKLLAEENYKYKDLVFVQTKVQGYKNLIYKIEALVHWAGEFLKYYEQYRFILKTDDDALVRPDILRDIVIDGCGTSVCYFGAQFKPNEAFATKDYIQHTNRDRFVFPFMSGAGYGFSRSALLKLYGMSKGSGGLIKYEAEDATMGQWMSQIEGITFAKLKWVSKPMCENDDTEIIHAIKKVNQMADMMDLMKQNKDWKPYCKTIRLFGL